MAQHTTKSIDSIKSVTPSAQAEGTRLIAVKVAKVRALHFWGPYPRATLVGATERL
jgi:hypothetical protein